MNVWLTCCVVKSSKFSSQEDKDVIKHSFSHAVVEFKQTAAHISNSHLSSVTCRQQMYVDWIPTFTGPQHQTAGAGTFRHTERQQQNLNVNRTSFMQWYRAAVSAVHLSRDQLQSDAGYIFHLQVNVSDHQHPLTNITAANKQSACHY